MVSRRVKHWFYILFSPLMLINGWRYRTYSSQKLTRKVTRVQLGPGKRNYLPGWINVDANFLTAKLDVWADLRNGLPFTSGSVEAFYSHHVIEHLPDALLPSHFRELFRCLRPGGVIRVGGPNADMAIRKYVSEDLDWFGDFPDKRASLGGRFANFILVRGEHLTILTPSYLDELASAAGFEDIRICKPITETSYPAVFDQQVLGTEWEETPEAPHTLILEAKKPD
jgi:SAM-dependent methyltransferase